jgi:hypothetical protein
MEGTEVCLLGVKASDLVLQRRKDGKKPKQGKGEIGMCRTTWKTRAVQATKAALLGMTLLMWGATQGSAEQSPPGCNGNTSQIDLFRSSIFVVNGGQITYTVRVRNDSSGGCDVRNATVSFRCPSATGTATGPLTNLVSGVDFNIPTAPVDVGTVTCAINVNPGVTTATAAANLSGDLASIPGDAFDSASAFKDITVIIRTPCISVTKECAVTQGTPDNPVINFNGTVTNCGDETLNNVTVVDNLTGLVIGPITLVPGASQAYSGSYIATTNPSTNVVTATGTGNDTGTQVNDTDNAICSIPCNPGINVTKVCQNAVSATAPITFNGTVTNTGNVTLSNVTVSDDKAGQVLGPITLAPGASAAYSGSYVATECPSTDTVTAAGTVATAPGICAATVVQAQASATCSVPSGPAISVTKVCAGNGNPESPVINFGGTVSNTGSVTLLTVTVTDDKAGVVLGPITLAAGASAAYSGSYVPTECPSTDTVTAAGTAAGEAGCGGGAQVTANASCTASIPSNPSIAVTKTCTDGEGGSINFAGTVTNTGNVTLTNVTVSDDKVAGIVLGPISLAPGASATYSGSYVPTVVPSTDTVTATGTDNSLCGNGQSRQVTATASATCGVRPGSCRVTGGGKQFNSNPQVRYVTHGGQVGAPYSVATPFTPDSDCITGQWQHVRHIKAGLRGNFHGRSFDSLQCACLGCPENEDAPAVIGGLCNPDDRVCGPEPRRAPANKICFSGVGDYTLTRGKKAPRSVVFRVDIEDRSEPGNSQAGGATPPPDRYRIRIWFLDGNEGNSETASALALRQAIACSDPLTEVVTARVPDIDDGGDMDRGNHQIHPATGATCKSQ